VESYIPTLLTLGSVCLVAFIIVVGTSAVDTPSDNERAAWYVFLLLHVGCFGAAYWIKYRTLTQEQHYIIWEFSALLTFFYAVHWATNIRSVKPQKKRRR